MRVEAAGLIPKNTTHIHSAMQQWERQVTKPCINLIVQTRASICIIAQLLGHGVDPWYRPRVIGQVKSTSA